MGNRAVITTRDKQIGIYLHWNGGRDTIEPLLKYCELKGYRPPSQDCYGWARIAQVMGNFFGGSLSIGVDRYDRLDTDNWDNGVYIIDGWEIVGREFQHRGEQHGHDFDEMLRAFDECMPESERLGDFLDSVEIKTSEIRIGDEVFMHDPVYGKWEAFEVVGFGDDHFVRGKRGEGVPYVAHYGNADTYKKNPNNYIDGETCFIKPRDDEKGGK